LARFASHHAIRSSRAKAAVGPHENANIRPALANVGNDARYIVRSIEARHTQLGSKQVP
jgi:hypothetical protein